MGAIDLSRVTALDTVGAWLFEKLARRFSTPSSKTSFVAVPETYAGLMHELEGVNRRRPVARPRGNAMHRNRERVFNPDRKDYHWGKRKPKRDQ